jgi:secreted PhoX family phosphatase
MASDFGVRARAGRWLIILAALASLSIGATPVIAKSDQPGFKTSRPSMLTTVPAGASAVPLVTVGDALPGGGTWASIPDGISIDPHGNGRVNLYVNHETSTVPFPIAGSAAAWNPTASGNGTQNDFTNAQVSMISLHQQSLGVTSWKTVIPSSANYLRFCSNFLAGPEQSFSRQLLFTNEETNDIVSRTGTAYPVSPVSEPPYEQGGVSIAVDVQTGQFRPIYGMGRLNHENEVAIPGYGHPVVMTGDDTFTSNPPGSQVYMYSAASSNAVWNDEGVLYGFKSTTPGFRNYYDFGAGSAATITGTFVAMDPAAAHGTQGALENDSDAKDVFQFIRIEDIAYDRTNSNVVYLADTGRGSASPGLKSDGSAGHASTNGRIWRMELDPANPLNVLSLRILVDGDTVGFKNPTAIHQPDNLETTANGHLMVTEDPSSSNQWAPSDPDPNKTTAQVWMVDTATAVKSVVARVNQAEDGQSTDVDGFANGNYGAWEATGIVDASSVAGPGTFFVNVQAHTLWLAKQASGDTATWTSSTTPFQPGADGQTDWMYKLESGQLLLLTIPGA